MRCSPLPYRYDQEDMQLVSKQDCSTWMIDRDFLLDRTDFTVPSHREPDFPAGYTSELAMNGSSRFTINKQKTESMLIYRKNP